MSLRFSCVSLSARAEAHGLQFEQVTDTTSGASLEFKFVAEPRDDYYLEVSPFFGIRQ
jgi:hypothetical protein